MSVMVTVETQMTDTTAAIRACERRMSSCVDKGTTLECRTKKNRPFTLYKDSLKVYIDSDWKQQTLEELNQAYAIEKAIMEAEAEGRAWSEETLKDGSVVIEIDY